MDYYTIKLIKWIGKKVAEGAVGWPLGAAGWGTYSANLGATYNDPYEINGYTYNIFDGNWYENPPAPDYGINTWTGRADAEMTRWLNETSRSIQRTNEIMRFTPEDEVVDRTLFGYFLLGERPIDHHAILQKFWEIMNWRPMRDPLAIDLDGDGIETVGADGSVLFDHDGDGVTGGTGWIRSDDGLLVLDRDGNGLIDSGRELFGVDTILADGSRANSGFEALAALDTNGDGVFDASDAEFTNVRVWRDLNQDGVSQANELFSLGDVGLVSINVTPASTNNVDLGNGNVIDNAGFFTRADGSSGMVGDMLFATNSFFRDFSGSNDPIEVSEEASRIPGLMGSGSVRDLAEAATISADLLEAVLALGPQMTRDDMLAQVRLILELWADTSAMPTTEQFLEAGGSGVVYFHGAVPSEVAAQGADAVLTWKQQQHALLSPIIEILERFNGSTLFSIDGDTVSTGGTTFGWRADSTHGQMMSIQLDQAQIALIMRAYEAMQELIYGRVVMQTRLAHYSELVTASQGADGSIVLDASAMIAALEELRSVDPVRAIIDAMDLVRYDRDFDSAINWDSHKTLHDWISEYRQTLQGIQVLIDAGLVSRGSGSDASDFIEGTDASDSVSAGSGDDIVFGDEGDDTLRGNGGDDLLDGGEGVDRLYGGIGNDTLIGGAGNDLLEGEDGDDTYRIAAGDGMDQITEAAGNDRVVFEGLNPADVTAVERHGYHLVIRLGTGQALTLLNYFYSTAYQVERFQFADGTEWLGQDLLDRVVTPGTINGDAITGDGLVDRIYGFAGNDTLRGNGGDDLLDGGDGADRLYGGTGNDLLMGGLGNDLVEGEDGDDTYVIRAGDGVDQITEAAGNDRVVFEGLNPADVTAVERHGYHLVIRLGSGQALTLLNYFYSASYQVETFEFAGGETWTQEDILARVVTPGTAGNDSITGDGLIDRIFGFAGDDTLRGNAGDDLLDGGEGVDRLYGGIGNDTLVGGAGNDLMEGEGGDDTYVIRQGDGVDQVTEADGNDRVVFEGLNPADVTAVERYGYHLVIRLGSGQALTLLNYFYSTAYQVERFQFADGTEWLGQDLLDRVVTPGTINGDAITGDGLVDRIYGFAGNDTLRGNGGDDLLDGGEGADRMYGGSGNDTLVGGIGNDVMEGDDGNDTYLIRAGDGADQISESAGSDRVVFEGLDPSSITAVERHGYHLVIRLGEGQSLTVLNYFYSAGYQVETFEFAGGVTWTQGDILAQVVTPGTAGNDSITGDGLNDQLFGFAGDDTLRGNAGDDLLDGGDGSDRLYGGTGNDFLVGGLGNDLLEGDTGNDVYRIRLGDGSDVIGESAGDDRVVFEDIDPSMISAVERSGYHLVIRLQNGETLTVQNHFYSAGYQVESFEFADGTSWSVQDLLDRAVTPVATQSAAVKGHGEVDRTPGFVVADLLPGHAGDEVEPVLPDDCVAEPVSPLLPGGCVAVPADPVLPGGQHAHSGGIGTRNWDQAEVTALVHHLNDSMAMFSAGNASLPGSLVQPMAPPVLWVPVA